MIHCQKWIRHKVVSFRPITIAQTLKSTKSSLRVTSIKCDSVSFNLKNAACQSEVFDIRDSGVADEVTCVTPQSAKKARNSFDVNWGPPSEYRMNGTFDESECSTKVMLPLMHR